MSKLLFIALGGAFGSVMRYLVHGWVQSRIDIAFPLGTLVVNVVGCLLIGMLAALFAGPIAIRDDIHLGLTVGILGGFTTFSTFGLDTFKLGTEDRLLAAITNVGLSCTLGLVAVWVGYRVTERMFGA